MVRLIEIGRFRLFLAWYDLWVGAYVDAPGRALYVCPIPCVVARIDLSRGSRR